jgi:hypothetical protein
MKPLLILFSLLLIIGASCAPGIHAWTDADTRKATDIVHAADGQLALCPSDGGPCKADDMRALGDVVRCKSASLLYTHRQPVPDDAGGGCN